MSLNTQFAVCPNLRRNPEKARLVAGGLEALYPHQANLRIINAAVEKMASIRQVAINIDRYANTTAATIRFASRKQLNLKRFRPTTSFSSQASVAGFTWGSLLLRWEN
jgi:3-oxoacyl-[acyl-carrier-protein] synthase-3